MKCTIVNNSNFWFQCYFDFGIKNEPFWIFGDYLSYGIVDITKIISELPSKSFKSTIYKNISNITNSQNIWSNIPKGVEPLCTLCSYEFFDNCIIYQGLYAAIYKIDSITEKDNTLKIQTTVYASDFVEILTGSKHCFEIEFDNDAIIIDGASYYR